MILESGALVEVIFRMVSGVEIVATTLVDITTVGGGQLGVDVGSTMMATLLFGLIFEIQLYFHRFLIIPMKKHIGPISGRNCLILVYRTAGLIAGHLLALQMVV